MATPPPTNRTTTGTGVINPYKKAPRPQQHQRKNQNTGGFSCAQFDHITSTRSAITNEWVMCCFLQRLDKYCAGKTCVWSES
eukprot:scaffold215114_cov74-Attheya_sp.AAC.2